MEKAAGERIFLRHAQITNIVGKSKGEKREWIAKIIGYEAITGFRAAVQSTFNALQKDPAYTTARQMAQNAENELFKQAGSIIATEQDLLAKANEIIKPYKLDFLIADRETYQQALTQLRAKITQPEGATIKFRLDQLQKQCKSFVQNAGALIATKDAFVTPYNKLAGDKSAVSQLNIGQFLTAGKEMIEGSHFTAQKCPFCLKDHDLEKLREEVELRIQKIDDIQKQYDDIETLKDNFVQAANVLIAICRPLATDYADLTKFKSLFGEAEKALSILNSWAKAADDGFSQFQPVALSQDDIDAIRDFAALAKTQAALAKSEGDALELSEQEKRLVEIIEKLRDLEKQFDQYRTSTATVQAFEKQILSLTTLFDHFLVVQNAALQTVLDKISADVGTYYTALHPGENVDNVRLQS